MSKRGRPPVLNNDKRRAVCAILSKGGTLVDAAECLQCSVRVLQLEQRRNPLFREQVRKAKAQALLAPFQIMRKAARSNWRAASWMIERADQRGCQREAMENYEHRFETPVVEEESSLLERLRAGPDRRLQSPEDTPREISPGFARDCPKTTSFLLALRERGSSEPKTECSPL